MSNLVTSWKQLQDDLPSIVDRLSSDSSLAVAAAANPLYALEEFGYQFDPRARQEIEDRIRFGPRKAVRLQQLRNEVFEAAGFAFDVNSGTELSRVLFDELGLEASGRRVQATDLEPMSPQLGWAPKKEDPLEALRDSHQAIGPLLEYRRLDASEPRLASRQLYEDVRRGKRATPLRFARAVLRSAAVARSRGRKKEDNE
jgi:hypothetical protein